MKPVLRAAVACLAFNYVYHQKVDDLYFSGEDEGVNYNFSGRVEGDDVYLSTSSSAEYFKLEGHLEDLYANGNKVKFSINGNNFKGYDSSSGEYYSGVVYSGRVVVEVENQEFWYSGLG